MASLALVPDSIGRYRILSQLGRGSMGRVFLALDPHIDRKIALKVFEPFGEFSSGEEDSLQDRFVLEARAAGKINHPGVVTIFDAATDPKSGLSYIAMEWVEGTSLERLIRERGPLPIRESLDIVHQVALALDAAHRQGLVHRDVKPGNILLDREGRAKVTDFGIAKLASLDLTMTGWIPGTPFYMSPEQVRNENVDGRSDLFSLGVVLYQCLTAQVPFEGDSLASVTYKILEIDPRPLRLLRPTTSAALEDLLRRALEKDPEDRFASCRELAEALELVADRAESDRVGDREEAGVRPVRRRQDQAGAGRSGEGSGTLLLADEEIRPDALEQGEATRWRVARPRLAWLALGFLLLNGLAFTLGLKSTRAVPEVAEAVPVPEIEVSSPESGARSRPTDLPGPVMSEPTESTPVGRTATLHFYYKNRLKNARLQIRIDGETVWSGGIEGPRNFFVRTVGRQFRTRLEVPEGARTIEVRVIGSENKIDLIRSVERNLRAGKVYTLQASFVPPKSLKLAWKD